MAEERLIDDDKDKKYRIRKNENGEEELVIIDDGEEEEEVPAYDVITDTDDNLSKEEIAERAAQRREIALKKAEELKATAREKIEEGDFESAQYALSQAHELTEYDGELYYLQLKAISRGMTNFLDLQKCVDAAEGVKEYSDREQKEELKSLSQPLKDRIGEFEEKCSKIGEENERGKAERRETFLKGRRNALIVLICTCVPFIALFAVAIAFTSMMLSDLSEIYVVLTIVFAVLAAVAFFALLFTLKRFLSANRKVKLNELDSATKIGREFISCSEELDLLKKIYSSLENDIS